MAVTDLTGTKWVFNDEITGFSGTNSFAINFISNNTNYTNIYRGTNNFSYSKNGSNRVYVYDTGDEPPFVAGWTDDAYKTIEITGGTDATNSELIAWLQANAVQQVEPEPATTNTFSFGNLTTANVYFGTQQVRKIYLGNSLVWEKEIIPENVLLAQDGALLVSGGGYLITTEVTLISFTIQGTSYQAESGMTWGEWVNSSYNTAGFRVLYDCIYTQIAPYKVTYGSQRAHPSDAIIANTAYTLIGDGADD